MTARDDGAMTTAPCVRALAHREPSRTRAAAPWRRRTFIERVRSTMGAAVAGCTLAGAVALAGCTGYQRYEPAPLDARASTAAVQFSARRLDDPALVDFLRAAGAAPTDSGWSPRQLALAALVRRADLTEARSALAAARAAERIAGLRPEASASGSIERASQIDEGKSSPWTVSLTSGLTYETAGKRAARRARARASTLAARLRLDVRGWEAAQTAASAAAALLAATREVRDADAEASGLRAVLTLLRGRFAEGRISLADVAQAESDVRAATLATVQARQARSEAAATLARAIAAPVAAVDSLPLRAYAVGGCGTAAAAPDSLRAVALQHRFDLGAALADYAATEADVRAEIARQYPDVSVGPGFGWDQGVVRWVLGMGTPAIPRDRNRGPIAEALARRAAQAAHVRVVQDSVLAGVDAALAACRAVDFEVAAADSVRTAAQRAVALAEAAYGRGETGRTEVALTRLALLRAARVARQATDRRALAGVALETASGVWLAGAPLAWPDLSTDPIPREGAGGPRR